MSPEEFAALNEVFERRLHSTRDPELQSLLWQLGEFANETNTDLHAAEATLGTIARLLNVYRERQMTEESNG